MTLEKVDLTKYYRGKACRKCGNHWRYISNKKCTQCQLKKNVITNRRRTKEGRANSYHKNRSHYTGDAILLNSVKRVGNFGTAPQNRAEAKELQMFAYQLKTFNGNVGKPKYTYNHIEPLARRYKDGQLIAGKTTVNNLQITTIELNQKLGNTPPSHYDQSRVFVIENDLDIKSTDVTYLRKGIFMNYGYHTGNVSKEVAILAEENNIPIEQEKFKQVAPTDEISVAMQLSGKALYKLQRCDTLEDSKHSHQAISKLRKARDSMISHMPVRAFGLLNTMENDIVYLPDGEGIPAIMSHTINTEPQQRFIEWWFNWQRDPEGVEEFNPTPGIKKVKAITLQQALDMLELFGIDAREQGYVIVSNQVFDGLPQTVTFFRLMEVQE